MEKNSFITLPGKGDQSGLMLSKLYVPNLERVVRTFIVIVQREEAKGEEEKERYYPSKCRAPKNNKEKYERFPK